MTTPLISSLILQSFGSCILGIVYNAPIVKRYCRLKLFDFFILEMKVDTSLKRFGSYSNAAMSFVPKSWIVKGPNEKLFNRRTTGSTFLYSVLV